MEHANWLSLWRQVFGEVKGVVDELKGKYGVKTVGAEGFCWGGHYTVALLGT